MTTAWKWSISLLGVVILLISVLVFIVLVFIKGATKFNSRFKPVNEDDRLIYAIRNLRPGMSAKEVINNFSRDPDYIGLAHTYSSDRITRIFSNKIPFTEYLFCEDRYTDLFVYFDDNNTICGFRYKSIRPPFLRDDELILPPGSYTSESAQGNGIDAVDCDHKKTGPMELVTP